MTHKHLQPHLHGPPRGVPLKLYTRRAADCTADSREKLCRVSVVTVCVVLCYYRVWYIHHKCDWTLLNRGFAWHPRSTPPRERRKENRAANVDYSRMFVANVDYTYSRMFVDNGRRRRASEQCGSGSGDRYCSRWKEKGSYCWNSTLRPRTQIKNKFLDKILHKILWQISLVT